MPLLGNLFGTRQQYLPQQYGQQQGNVYHHYHQSAPVVQQQRYVAQPEIHEDIYDQPSVQDVYIEKPIINKKVIHQVPQIRKHIVEKPYYETDVIQEAPQVIEDYQRAGPRFAVGRLGLGRRLASPFKGWRQTQNYASTGSVGSYGSYGSYDSAAYASTGSVGSYGSYGSYGGTSGGVKRIYHQDVPTVYSEKMVAAPEIREDIYDQPAIKDIYIEKPIINKKIIHKTNQIRKHVVEKPYYEEDVIRDSPQYQQDFSRAQMVRGTGLASRFTNALVRRNLHRERAVVSQQNIAAQPEIIEEIYDKPSIRDVTIEKPIINKKIIRQREQIRKHIVEKPFYEEDVIQEAPQYQEDFIREQPVRGFGLWNKFRGRGHVHRNLHREGAVVTHENISAQPEIIEDIYERPSIQDVTIEKPVINKKIIRQKEQIRRHIVEKPYFEEEVIQEAPQYQEDFIRERPVYRGSVSGLGIRNKLRSRFGGYQNGYAVNQEQFATEEYAAAGSTATGVATGMATGLGSGHVHYKPKLTQKLKARLQGKPNEVIY